LGKCDPGANHGCRRVAIRGIPGDHSHRAVFIGLARSERTVGKNHSSVRSIIDGGIAGDFEGAYDLAERLFAATASREAFEGGYSDGGEKTHNTNDGEEFDEGECRRRSARMLEFWILDFGFSIGRRDGLLRSPNKNAVHGNKGDHN